MSDLAERLLGELLARVEGAEGPDRLIDYAVERIARPDVAEFADEDFVAADELQGGLEHAPPVTSSLDAALALCERVLGPEWDVHVFSDCGDYFSRVETMGERGELAIHQGHGGAGVERERWCLSILSAALRALIAQAAASPTGQSAEPNDRTRDEP